MTYATFSSESLITNILKELDLSIALFATYQHETSISAATIERSLAGKRKFDPRVEAAPLERLAKELRDLQKSYPIRLDWRDVSGIRSALARRHEQEQTGTAHQTIGEFTVVVGHVLVNDGNHAEVLFRTANGVAYQRTYQRGDDDISVAKFREYFPPGSDRVFCLPTRGAAEIVVGGCI